MRRRTTHAAVLAAWLLLQPLAAAAQGDDYLDGYHGPYRGRVVDAETKEPLAGAVVVARWLRVKTEPLRASTVHYAVRETLTEANGEFVLHAEDIETSAPEKTKHPHFEVFFPGYGSFLSLAFARRGFQRGDFEGSGMNIGLPRLSSPQERRHYLVSPFDFSEQPFAELPHLMRLVNLERLRLNLEPYPSMEQQR